MRLKTAPSRDVSLSKVGPNIATSGDLFVGREQALRDLGARVRDGGWVTLVGPPGVGKTRLVQEFIESGGADGAVLFIELAHARVTADVLNAICMAFDMPAMSGGADVAAALEVRGDLLLAFDNCEQLEPEAVEALAALQVAAPAITTLVDVSVGNFAPVADAGGNKDGLYDVIYGHDIVFDGSADEVLENESLRSEYLAI